MAGQHTYPQWLLNCKQGISDSREWNTFLQELHEAVQQQLTESHVQYFSDLSEAEKELFMERATKAIEGGAVSTNLFKKVSILMDQHLNEEVSRQLLEDQPVGTKSDLIIDNAEEGSLSLLRKWPDMKNKLYILLNQGMPPPIRQLAWKLFLTNNKVRKLYVDQLSNNPRAAISPYDMEISQKCESLLNTEPTFSDLKGSVGFLYGMKAVLSYYHASLKTKDRLRDMDHLLIVPFLWVASPNITRREPPAGRIVALLVEEYITFMQNRPGFIADSGSERHETELDGFVDKVAKALQGKHLDLTKVMIGTVIGSKERIVQTETGNYALLCEALTTLLRPMLRGLFITYFNFNTLLYIWDQYIIGLNTQGYAIELLAAVCIIYFSLCKDKLMKQTTSIDMERILKEEGLKLSIPQFQYEIKQKYYKTLYSMLLQDQKAAVPVLDPTQAQHPPWRHWYNDVIPPFNKPQDRKKAREEREAERERLLRQQRDLDAHKKEKSLKDRRDERSSPPPLPVTDEEEQLYRMTAAATQKVEDEKNRLEAELAEERRRRQQAEDRSKAEIERLQLQLSAFQGRPVKESPTLSEYSLQSYISRVIIPPPPSRASMSPIPIPKVEEPRTPTPAIKPEDAAKNVFIDFLSRVKQGADKVAHGDGQEKEVLDRETEGYLTQNVKDIKRAQREIFGHTLQPGEFDSMSAQEQQDMSEQMMKLMQRWREERRSQELAKGKK